MIPQQQYYQQQCNVYPQPYGFTQPANYGTQYYPTTQPFMPTSSIIPYPIPNMPTDTQTNNTNSNTPNMNSNSINGLNNNNRNNHNNKHNNHNNSNNNNNNNAKSMTEGPSTIKRVNEKELDQGDTKRVKISSAPMSRFERQKCCGHGSFGKVWSAKEIATGNIVALKQIKISGSEGFPRTAIREIGIMKKHFHPNILSLSEVVWADFGDVYLVMEYFDFDLRKLLEKHSIKLSIPEVKYLFQQLTTGMCYMHKNLIMHRDLKTENILINNHGHLKICDFGLSRSYTPGQLKYYTPVVVTLWYRSPELLLGPCAYSWEIDQWSVGCIFAELLRSCVLFAGSNEVDQVDKIFSILGTPNDNTWKNFRDLPGTENQSYRNYAPRLNQIFTTEVVSSIGYELLSGLLTYQPDRRMTASDAMSHDYFIESPGAVNYIDILSKI